ncbi:MAG: metallophosphoesterase, partial [Gemmatimonadaceae bacterium]
AGGDEHNPVLSALKSAIAGDSAHNLVVVVGDNVYPNGLTESGPSREEGERRLRAQVDAVREARADAVFLPGNHDWGTDRARGVEILSREMELVDRAGGSGIRWLPTAGCPGPSVVDVGESVRVIGLDTEWWLRPDEPRGTAAAGCLTSESAVLDSLRRAIANAGSRRVVVAGHHPLATVGPHGGRFGWQQHLFPLREVWSPLWIPLPIVGSLYPLMHVALGSRQDLRSPINRHFRESIESVLRERPPFAYASGHEHNLQVLDGKSAPLLLVSGGGSRDRPSYVVPSSEARFAERANGFIRVDVWTDGEAQVTVMTVDRQGNVCECFHLRVK